MTRLGRVFTACLLTSHLLNPWAEARLFTCSHAMASVAAEFGGREESGFRFRRAPDPGAPRPSVGKVKLEPLDRETPEGRTRAVELVRLDAGPHRPDRETVNEIVGWKKGEYKVVLLAQEIDNTVPTPGSSIATRVGHALFLRPATAVGILAKRHLHVSVAYIDPKGNWFRANPTGPLSPIKQDGYLSKNVAYLPLDLSPKEAERAAEGIRKSIGSRSPFGCANGSCQTVADALDAGRPAAERRQFPATASYTLSEVIDGQKLPVSNIYLSGTRVTSFHDLRVGFANADWNSLAPLAYLAAAIGL